MNLIDLAVASIDTQLYATEGYKPHNSHLVKESG